MDAAIASAVATLANYGPGGLAALALIYAIWRFEVILKRKDDDMRELVREHRELVSESTSAMTELATLIKILVSRK